MGIGNKADNNAEKFGGKAKEFIGEKTGDREMQTEGQADQASAGIKQAGERVKDAAKDIKEGLTGNK